MKRRNQDFLLGLAVLSFAALFISTILFLYPLLRAGGKPIVIHFNHEEGLAPLKPGSPVTLGGSQTVGQVRHITLKVVDAPPGSGRRVETVFVVTCEVDPNLVLYNDCEIATDQPAIGGGGSVVILNVGTPGHSLVQPVRGRAPLSLAAAISQLSRRLLTRGGMVDRIDDQLNPRVEDSLLAKVLRSLDDLNAMTGELRVQLSPRDHQALLFKVHSALDDINGATAALREEFGRADAASLMTKVHAALDRLGVALGEAAALVQDSRPVVHNILAGVDRGVQTVNDDMLSRLREEFNRADPHALLGKIHLSMERVNAALADVQVVSGETKRLVVLNRPAIDRTLQNVREMSEQLRAGSQEIRLAPWRLLFQPDSKEREKIGVFETARTFAEAAAHLDDAAARLQAMLELGRTEPTQAADAELQAIQQSLQEAFERFRRAEGYLWDRLK